jgi:hypothetical protein
MSLTTNKKSLTTNKKSYFSYLTLAEIEFLLWPQTICELVIEARNIDIVQDFLDKGGDLNSPLYGDPSVFIHQLAVETCNLKVVQHYVNKGGNINGLDTYGGSFLANAIERGHRELVFWLIQNGADLKDTLVKTAYLFKHYDIVSALLLHGAILHKYVANMYWEERLPYLQLVDGCDDDNAVGYLKEESTSHEVFSYMPV